MPRSVDTDDRAQREAERRGALALLAAGLVTQAEPACILGVHRVTIHRYCKRLGIDASFAREKYLCRMTARALGRGWRPPTKQQLRERGHFALEQWRAQGSKPRRRNKPRK